MAARMLHPRSKAWTPPRAASAAQVGDLLLPAALEQPSAAMLCRRYGAASGSGCTNPAIVNPS